MPFSFSTVCINAGLDAIETAIGASAVLKLRSGTMPANVAAADSGTVLATISLPSDWMAAASAREKLKAGTWSGTGSAAGTVGHFRIYAADGTTAHMQGTVVTGTTPADGQLVLSDVAIAIGQPVSISAFSIAETVASALAGEIILSGTTFTATQLKTGLMGMLDEETAGRIALLANGAGALIFTFTGTGFNIAAYQGASGQPTDMMEASVDGAAFASMGAASGGVYAVTGLSNALHTVIIRTNVAYGNGGNIRDTGTVLTIVGGTSVTLPRNNQAVTQGLSASIMKSANTFDTVTNAGIRIPTGKVFPGKVVRGPNENGRRNTPSFRIKTNATSLWIYGEDSYIWINDGTATTRYALNGTGSTVSFLTKLTGFSGLKSYSMWGVQNSNFVVAPFDGDFFTIPETGTFDEYGDSVAECTAYGVAADFGEATVYKTAVGLGRIGGNFGVSGNTIANLKGRIDAILNNKEITSKDVAYVTIGRNNADAALDATEISDYTYIVNALLAKSYGRIICRGVLGETSNPNPSVNTDIAAIVSGLANSRVVYCSVTGWTTSWTTTERPDGVHLSVTGTNALNTLQLANLPALIGTL